MPRSGSTKQIPLEDDIVYPLYLVSDTSRPIRFHTRKWIKPEDLNPNGTLFGGRLLQWIDEEAALYAIVQLDNSKVVTKFISAIDFRSSAEPGDVVEIGIGVVEFGRTSLTLRCEVRNMRTHESIIAIDRIVFVNLDEQGRPKPHGKTKVEYVRDRLAKGAVPED